MTLGVGLNLTLRLDRLAPLLAIEDSGLSVREIGDRLGYHKTMTGSLRSWARHLRLIDESGRLTPLARGVLQRDAQLERPATATLLYAQLAMNPAAEMFFFLVNDILYHHALDGEWFDPAEIEPAARMAGVGSGSSAAGQHRRELQLMLHLLTSGAFAHLRAVERANGRVRANAVDLPTPVAALVLTESWPPNTAYRYFSELERPAGLGRIGLVRRAGLIRILRAAEQAGWAVVEQEAGLNRVARAGNVTYDSLLDACYDV